MNKSKYFKLASTAAIKASNDKSFKEKLQAFFRMLKANKNKQYKMSKKIYLSFFAFLYILSPIDFLPELLLGPFGLADDLAIFLYAINIINKEVKKFLDWEFSQQNQDISILID